MVANVGRSVGDPAVMLGVWRWTVGEILDQAVAGMISVPGGVPEMLAVQADVMKTSQMQARH